MLFVVPYLALSKDGPLREKVKSFFVPCALGGGIMAMLIPTSGVDFLEIGAYQCFVYHAGLVWLAFYYICSGQVELGFKTYLQNCLIMFLMMIGSIWVNSTLSVYGTNFMYTRKPPLDGLPILNLDNGWLMYILTLMAVGIVLFGIIHLPFFFKKKK